MPRTCPSRPAIRRPGRPAARAAAPRTDRSTASGGTIDGMPAATLPARSEIAPEFTWDLDSIYLSAGAWEQDFRSLEQRLPDLAAFQGKLGHSAEELAQGLALRDELGVTIGKLFSYAHMKRD